MSSFIISCYDFYLLGSFMLVVEKGYESGEKNT